MSDEQPPPPSAQDRHILHGGNDTPPPPPPQAPRNTIAFAGMIVSLLGLILGAVVIGGFVGIVGLVMSVVGLRRAQVLRDGTATAVAGIVLGVLSVLVSIAASVFFYVELSTETTIINGISSTSRNTTYPPQEDFESIVCTATNNSGFGRAEVTVLNRSEGDSDYTITVTWESESGEVRGETRADSIAPGEEATAIALALRDDVVIESCRVAEIQRRSSDLDFFG